MVQAMMKKIMTVVVFIGLLSGIGFSQNSFVSNQVMVMLDGNYKLEEVLQRFNSQSPFTLNHHQVLSARAHIYLLEFDSSSVHVDEVIQTIKNVEGIALAQKNHTHITLRSTVPNDLEYSTQWALNNSATTRIFAPQAWDLSTDAITAAGDTIVLAVVDGGMDIQHIDLDVFINAHEIPNNGIDDDSNGYIDDYHGWNAYDHNGTISSDFHGTHVAGIMGAKTNNSEGVAGVMWGAKLMPVMASSTLESEVIEGYGYVLEMRERYNETNGDSGAFVVVTNSSFGVDGGQPADYPIWCAFYDTLGAAGIVSAGATSNAGVNVDVIGDIPTTCPSNFLISVSNVSQSGTLNGGFGAVNIDLAAPGTNIRSTFPGHNYGNLTGTSMATPHVAGVVGAMFSAMCSWDAALVHQNPDSMALDVIQKLLQSVDSVSYLANKNATSGKLNMYKALQAIQKNHCLVYEKNIAEDTCGTCDGQIQVWTGGDFPPYTLAFSNTGLTIGDSILAQLCTSSEHFVTITDSTGFTFTDTLTVPGNDSIEITAQINPASSSSTGDGEIMLIPTGGTPPYTYEWEDGSTSASLPFISVGTYSFTVTDSNGCTKEDSAFLYSVGINENTEKSTFLLFPNPGTDNFRVSGLDNSNENTIEIFSVEGKRVFQNQLQSGNGELHIQVSLPPGMYFIKVNEYAPQKLVILQGN